MQSLGLGVLLALGALAAEAAVPSTAPPRHTVQAAADRAAPAVPPKRVLLLYDFPRLAPAIVSHEQALGAAVRSQQDPAVNLHTEYLNLTQLGPALPKEVLSYLRAKYTPDGVDAIAVTNSRLLRFVLQHRAELFPAAPLVFGSVERHSAADVVLPPDVTGLWLAISWTGTLDAAVRLQPDTARAVVVTGASGIDQAWAAAARAELGSGRRGVAVEHMSDLSLEAVKERVSALPAGTVVVMGAFTRDADRRELYGAEAARAIAGASAVPVYAMIDNHIGAGLVGGHVVSFGAQGRELGQLVLEVLRGRRPPARDGDTNVYRFDARQLHRWRLDPRRLPPGSAIVNEEPSLWRLYGMYVAVGAVLIGLQGALIAALLVQRSQRRRAQSALADRLRLETLLTDLSTLFASRANGDVDAQITDALGRVGEALGVDRITVGEVPGTSDRVAVTHAWTRVGMKPLPAVLDGQAMPWTLSCIRRGKAVMLARREDLPAEASADLRTVTAMGTQSFAIAPFPISETVTGYMSVAAIREEWHGPKDLVARLTLLAEVFASALARRRVERAMEETRQHREELAHVQRVAMLGELAGGLAHELNQPLAAISMNAAAAARLLDGTSGELEPGRTLLQTALRDIGTDGRRAAEIIRGIRAMFAKQVVRHAPVDLCGVIEQVIALLDKDFRDKGIGVATRFDWTAPRVMGDAVQLQQVVLNLLVNASDAVQRSARPEITVATTRSGADRLEMTVRDAGVGVAEHELEKIFERFVSTKPGGLGLGLPISRSILAQHGGRIWATRNPDAGLTLHVELLLDTSGGV